MYIAFKWLFGLALAMWLSMCCIDTVVKRNIETKQEGPTEKTIEININTTTIPVSRKIDFPKESYSMHVDDIQQRSVAYLHCFMFLAGALVVSLYNKKDDIILYTRRRISEINTDIIIVRLQEFLKITATKFSVVITKYCEVISVKVWTMINKLTKKGDQKPQRSPINIILLKKLQEIGEERKNLGQLLIAAIHENKNIRMQYQLETMAKNRLIQHIEKTQKEIKENRSRYVSFQQLYLVTHQENTFLKSRIKKLVKEKQQAENNLLEIMNEVYKSKNNELKSFCSRFIVRTKDNLLTSDIGAEIQKFLDKSRNRKSQWHLLERSRMCASSTDSLPSCANERLSEIVEDDVLVPLVSDAPKLKGLPGECVWTVKDKDGLIERLYEYDYETDLDNGDTIRRIRQYSVYYDKDCLLDFSQSRTIMQDTTAEPYGVDSPLTSQGFLTGSEAFQRFMQNNKNLISTPSLPEPPLLSK